jgi:hypothetical protein
VKRLGGKSAFKDDHAAYRHELALGFRERFRKAIFEVFFLKSAFE